MRTPVLVAFAAMLITVALVIGCQTYDFEPVQPLAVAQTTQSYSTIGRSLKPNMALLIDKSGSMTQAVNTSDPACDVGGGLPSRCGQTLQPVCPAGCPTRWGDLKAAMTQFLSNNGTVARLGAAIYPPSGACTATSAMAVDVSQSNDVGSELQQTANQILTFIQGITPAGGTPTAASIAFMATNPRLADSQRDNFILLLTDGLPNCNPNHPTPYPDANCKCTDTNPLSCDASRSQLCLDQAATVNAITAAYANNNIRTIVVGFGADTAGAEGQAVLEAMANAGQFPRTCPGGTQAECGTGTCDVTSKTCDPPFYQAGNAAELATVLANISKKLSQAPCDYTLAVTPSDANLIAVLVNGVVVPRGTDTWQYLAPNSPSCPTACPFGEVQLTGQLCTDARTATEQDPFKVEIRLLRTF